MLCICRKIGLSQVWPSVDAISLSAQYVSFWFIGKLHFFIIRTVCYSEYEVKNISDEKAPLGPKIRNR